MKTAEWPPEGREWRCELKLDGFRAVGHNRGQQLVIGGFMPNGNALDSILVGYYDRPDLIYAASVRAGIPSAFRQALIPHFEKLRISQCPFANLPESTDGRWGEGLTTAKMAMCCWLEPFIVARIEFLE